MSNVTIGRFLLLLLAISNPVFAESNVENTSAILALQREIAELRRVIEMQDKRIKVLEELVEKAPVGKNRAIFSGTPWHKENTWHKVKNGMSRQQVEAILGKPTSINTLGSRFITLFYEGDVSRSGFVVGKIELSQNRVYSINTPIFSTP